MEMLWPQGGTFLSVYTCMWKLWLPVLGSGFHVFPCLWNIQRKISYFRINLVSIYHISTSTPDPVAIVSDQQTKAVSLK